MSVAWEPHEERDWLDEYEDRELSRFGAFQGIGSILKLVAGCTTLYYTCKGLLWVGLRLSQ